LFQPDFTNIRGVQHRRRHLRLEEKFMKAINRFILAAAVAGGLFGAPAAQAGPNVPLCFAIANNYNQCLRQHQRGGGGGWHGGGGYGGGYGGGGYGRGGYGGGYGGWDDDYSQYRRQRRAGRAQQACAPWLLQMQANRCI
jgi:hypothetical protein